MSCYNMSYHQSGVILGGKICAVVENYAMMFGAMTNCCISFLNLIIQSGRLLQESNADKTRRPITIVRMTAQH
jgi:hypothetical protein